MSALARFPANYVLSRASPPRCKDTASCTGIAANVKLLIEQLEAGHSEGLTAYLTAMGFHSYSFGNILEIARQKPDATRVAGMYAWNQLGRKVIKGQKSIRILAPMIGIRKKKDKEAEKDITKQNQPALVGFRSAYVFDRLSRDLRPARVCLANCTTRPLTCSSINAVTSSLRFRGPARVTWCTDTFLQGPIGAGQPMQRDMVSSGPSVMRRENALVLRRTQLVLPAKGSAHFLQRSPTKIRGCPRAGVQIMPQDK
ncbi:MAG: hypothetical protein JWQ49_4856 [Edaphobacter sp.]|nr:hypothetical protein [Edaphobacter sp.]